MKITRMNWTNFKGLVDGEIVADGCDVIVSGRNGAGKSSKLRNSRTTAGNS